MTEVDAPVQPRTATPLSAVDAVPGAAATAREPLIAERSDAAPRTSASLSAPMVDETLAPSETRIRFSFSALEPTAPVKPGPKSPLTATDTPERLNPRPLADDAGAKGLSSALAAAAAAVSQPTRSPEPLTSAEPMAPIEEVTLDDLLGELRGAGRSRSDQTAPVAADPNEKTVESPEPLAAEPTPVGPAARLAVKLDEALKMEHTARIQIADRSVLLLDADRSAVLAAIARAHDCTVEDVAITALDWYVDALSADHENADQA